MFIIENTDQKNVEFKQLRSSNSIYMPPSLFFIFQKECKTFTTNIFKLIIHLLIFVGSTFVQDDLSSAQLSHLAVLKA